jgi:eukaryotic-like serine/threonine-protein kinase
MTADRWRQVEELFESAVARPPHERRAFLESVCNGDSSLRHEVESLLASDEQAGDLDEIVAGVAAEWNAEHDGAGLLGQMVGRYKVVEPLGAGGMGEVFLAHDTMLDRSVALKLLPRRFTSDRDRLRRFEQEARAASALNHPNIITIYEIGEVDGTRFMATEHVEGETLREVIGKPGRQISDVLEIGCQAASALDAAHRAGIIHRDIKPANIMLRADGFIKVLDFGLAKLTSARPQLDVTEPGRVMGTINYMSPEQAMGQPVDHRSDIFSLGVVLYELATARRLFDGQSEAAVYDAILHEPPPPIHQFVPKAPEEFDQVIRRALEKDPARRYQTAADFRTDLKRLTQGPGNTQAAAIAARERRVARRRRALRVAAIAAVLLALVAGALFLGGRFEAQQMRAAATRDTDKSIAVLPFENLSRNEETAVFADGIQDQVLTDLARIQQVKVIGRTSVQQYKPEPSRDLSEIGRQLGVGYLLEGSVQRAGERVRVNVRLMNAGNAQLVWAETYNRELADLLDIQQEISGQIATRLEANISPEQLAAVTRKPTKDLRAFELYTRGRTLYELAESTIEQQEKNARDAMELLTQATDRDPQFLEAWFYLARAHDFLYWTGIERTPERLALGQAAIDAAASFAPDSGETHLARATHLYTMRDFPPAERELAAARAKLPNNPRVFALAGYMARRQGRLEEGVHQLETATELDPRNPRILQELAISYFVVGDQAKGTATLDRALAVAPDHLGLRLARVALEIGYRADTQPLKNLITETLARDPAAIGSLAQHMITAGFYSRDFTMLRKGLDAIGDGWYGADWAKFPREFGEGMLTRLQGDEAAARKWFEAARVKQEQTVAERPEFGPALSVLGLIHAAFGNKEEAVRLGRRAVELVPHAKDALNAPHMSKNLAIIYSWIGDNSSAMEVLRQPIAWTNSVEYGQLVLDPMWDPLRSDPRFAELVASLAPRE